MHMPSLFKRFVADESGATAIEYGLICAGIAAVILGVINDLGASLIAKLTQLLNALGA
jgi:pilus assembly protein Flp/PilA